jgi:hypothetical protein
MLIYKIFNPIQITVNYVCDSQETINAKPENIIGDCIIGGESEANDILASNQSALLMDKAEIFAVNLQTSLAEGIVWSLVDLNTEPENIDREYFVLDPTTGNYEPVSIGLNATKLLLANMKQKYLDFCKLSNYIMMNSWK